MIRFLRRACRRRACLRQGRDPIGAALSTVCVAALLGCAGALVVARRDARTRALELSAQRTAAERSRAEARHTRLSAASARGAADALTRTLVGLGLQLESATLLAASPERTGELRERVEVAARLCRQALVESRSVVGSLAR